MGTRLGLSRGAWCLATLALATPALADQDAWKSLTRTCTFYTSHAYPVTYNIELNASCGVFEAPPGSSPSNPSDSGGTGWGLGLRAARPFDEGEIVAWVPANKHLWEPTMSWKIRHAVADACAESPRAYAESVLAVALLVERRDPDSRFKHYVAALAQVTLLHVPNVAAFAGEHLRVLNVTHPDLVEAFEEAMHCIEAAEALVPELRGASSPTRGERLWAYGVVKSRAVRLAGRLALVPVVDLANHAEAPSVALEFHEPGGGAALRSMRHLSQDDELTLAYAGGHASNFELLARYGFVLPSNRDGALLPFDLAAILDAEDARADAADADVTVDRDAAASCRDALRSPRLLWGAPLLLDVKPAECLRERLRRNHARRGDGGALDDAALEARAVELVGLLCGRLLSKYEQEASAINRLQQGGQRVGDWLALQVAHEAVDEMQQLQVCAARAASADRAGGGGPRKDDL